MDTYGFEPHEVRYQGRTFQPKMELHITILSQESAETLCQYVANHPSARDRIRGFIDQTDWTFYKQPHYYHVVASPEVESIIQAVETPGLPAFFHKLNQLLGHQCPLPPTHVTLFWRGDPQGIGIPTQADFNRLIKGEVPAEVVQAE